MPNGASVRDFYDGFADEYHLVYGDRWEAAVQRQGVSLARLIRAAIGSEECRVLDCSCGIGTQAIGLARQGCQVVGTDISERAVTRARIEAARLGVHASFAVADFRDLTSVEGSFDVVISCDNAIPHLLRDEDVSEALRAMWSKLTVAGLLLIGIRDDDEAPIDRPAVAPPLVIDGPPRRILVRYHDWDTAGPCYTAHFFVLTEGEPEWSTSHHSTRYRAVSRDALERLVADAGFTDTTWHEGEEVGLHQPLLQARRAGESP